VKNLTLTLVLVALSSPAAQAIDPAAEAALQRMIQNGGQIQQYQPQPPPAPAPPPPEAAPPVANPPPPPMNDANGSSTGGWQKAPEPPAPVYEYKSSMWSCNCANYPRKICDKGFAFGSISGATHYARQKCGEECIPNCSSQAIPPAKPPPRDDNRPAQ
jgi:hypothetical protein